MNVELLAPAGSLESLDAAIGEGADAVYFGLKSFNARMRGTNFAWNQAEATVDALHKAGKKAYITVNTVLQEDECERMYRFLTFLSKIGADALIVQDLGVLKMLRLYFPKMKVHASTQMNIASSSGANVASRQGVSRVVLARELSLEEIKTIHQKTNCELEVFVHGSLCISESGLCMFSSYLGGKSANRGMCTQACRRYYKTEFADKKQAGYFFSPYDLQLIDVVPQLVSAGVASFKIEGRMKSAEYVGQVVKAYRYVLDNWNAEKGEEVINKGKALLLGDFSRNKTHYHIFNSSLDSVLEPNQAGGTGISLGKIMEVVPCEKLDELCTYICFSSSRTVSVGDSVRIHEKNDKKRESCKVREIKNEEGKQFVLVEGVHKKGDFVYLIQEKNTKRYPHILPKNLDKYKMHPSDEKLPSLKLGKEEYSKPKSAGIRKEKNKKKELFKAGLYVQVSSFVNIQVLLSAGSLARPVKLIVNLNEETKEQIENYEMKKGINPFSKKDILISLDPFLPESKIEALKKDIAFLLEHGYFSFVLNNLAHIKILKEFCQAKSSVSRINLIAGPYLYTFNRYAIKYLEDEGLTNIVSPIENSYENVEKCYTNKAMKEHLLLNIFAYPALFRISSPLPNKYDFLYFSDKENIIFKAFSTNSSSFVLPEKPFSITHRVAQLKKDGFERFLIDLSHTALNIKEYRFISNAFTKSLHIEDTSQFNWKEGFYKA